MKQASRKTRKENASKRPAESMLGKNPKVAKKFVSNSIPLGTSRHFRTSQ
jgi:hypothetical protein